MIDKKIFLLGFMGSGKSTVGRELAAEFNLHFIDTDEVIEKLTHKSIPEIFESRGEDYFRSLEKIVFEQVSEVNGPCIVATGGGFPCFNDLMAQMNDIGITVYLQCQPEVLLERIKDELSSRPLFKTTDDHLEFIKTSLAERSTIYETAQIVIDANADIESILTNIHKKLS